jgi:hypothetical protein
MGDVAIPLIESTPLPRPRGGMADVPAVNGTGLHAATGRLVAQQRTAISLAGEWPRWQRSRSEGRWAMGDRPSEATHEANGGSWLARGGDDTDASVYLMVREYNDAVELAQPRRPMKEGDRRRHAGPRSRGERDGAVATRDSGLAVQTVLDRSGLGEPVHASPGRRSEKGQRGGGGGGAGRPGEQPTPQPIHFSRRFRVSWASFRLGSPDWFWR